MRLLLMRIFWKEGTLDKFLNDQVINHSIKLVLKESNDQRATPPSYWRSPQLFLRAPRTFQLFEKTSQFHHTAKSPKTVFNCRLYSWCLHSAGDILNIQNRSLCDEFISNFMNKHDHPSFAQGFELQIILKVDFICFQKFSLIKAA